ncbi:RlpA-like double-psi beta-barrel-protein domain-containing protein-containing protein [Chiua virens]|nr:RlpA-like double-psi beta-barrel-protein domain-containing protein-containing protein [Chiua virens]
MRRSTFFTLINAILVFTVQATGSPIDQQLEQRTKHGRGTWFDVGLGACGNTNVNSDHIVALAIDMYNGGSHCGKSVTITNTVNGKTATGIVADECPVCGFKDLDMSPSLFKELGDLNTGVLAIAWNLN